MESSAGVVAAGQGGGTMRAPAQARLTRAVLAGALRELAADLEKGRGTLDSAGKAALRLGIAVEARGYYDARAHGATAVRQQLVLLEHDGYAVATGSDDDRLVWGSLREAAAGLRSRVEGYIDGSIEADYAQYGLWRKIALVSFWTERVPSAKAGG